MVNQKNRLPVWSALLCAAFVLGFINGKTDFLFDQDDIWHAQKVIGIKFSPAEIDTLTDYLERNFKGYDTMRQFALDNETFPVLLFDPHPDGFEVPLEAQRQPKWDLPDVDLPEQKEELAFYSVEQLASLIRNRKLTSVELTELYLQRIARYDSLLESVITLTPELALEQAKHADAELRAGTYRGPLHGIPYGVKDLMALEGYPTTWGAVPYKEQEIGYTATVIQKLEKAGAVLVGKLSSGALARGDVWFGGKTKNPWDLEQGASGSSAGSGAATAAGLVAFAIGTETLGSIVSPATRCGITGLRPTYGRVSRHGVMSLSWSMDKVGPLCRTAKDCALVLQAIFGPDGHDRTVKQVAFNYNGPQSWESVRVGFLEDQFEKDTTDNGANNAALLEFFQNKGINLIPIQTPDSMPYPVFDIILRAEAGAFFDQLILERRDVDMVQQSKRSRANSLRQSRFIPAVEYLQANRHRKRLIEAMDDVFEQVDVLISPTFGGRQLLITNLTGHPSIALPNGFNEEAHPTSFTLVGKLYDEATLVGLAETFQEMTDFEEAHPPFFQN